MYLDILFGTVSFQHSKIPSVSKDLKDWKLFFLAFLPVGFQLQLADEKNFCEMESGVRKRSYYSLVKA